MNDPKILVLISRHIEEKQTDQEKQEFLNWLNTDKNNTLLYEKIRNIWMGIEEKPTPFFKRFNRAYLTKVVVSKTLGNLVGFAVGMLVTNSFTHYVTERRSIKNLFGLAGRKKVVVNDVPEWAQYLMSVILGFMVLELINYFFETKTHIKLYNYLKAKLLRTT